MLQTHGFTDSPTHRPTDESSTSFEDSVVSFFTDAADLLGIPKSVAAIYGICFASAEPLSFAEIETRLAISKGSVSQGLRLLKEIGALKPVATEGSRVERYEPDIELRKLIGHYLEQRVAKQLAAGQAKIKAIKAALPTQPKEPANKLLAERVRSLEGWHSKTAAILPLVRTALKLQLPT